MRQTCDCVDDAGCPADKPRCFSWIFYQTCSFCTGSTSDVVGSANVLARRAGRCGKCVVNEDCLAGQVCNIDTLECVAPYPNGAKCSDPAECGGRACTSPVSLGYGTCKTALPRGAKCSDGTQCLSTLCLVQNIPIIGTDYRCN